MLHFVNTGPRFPYTYYIGVMTALRAQERPVRLWLVERPRGPYFDLLCGLDDEQLEIVEFGEEVPNFPALEGKTDHEKRVAVFDWAMWKIVAEHGGVVMGLDSLTLGDIEGLLPADKAMMVARDDAAVPDSYAGHGAIVQAGSELAQEIHERGEAALWGPAEEFVWGSAGILPFLDVAQENMEQVAVAEFGLLGGCNHDGKAFYVYQEDAELLHPDTRTIPLYATAAALRFANISPTYVRSGRSLYARLVRRVLTEEEWDPLIEEGFVREIRHFRFHLLGLAHLPTVADLSTCAYTQKIIKLARMLKSLNHEVIFYGVEGSRVECDEFVEVLSEEKRREVYGDYDWWRGFFKHSGSDGAYGQFNQNAIDAIWERGRRGDFLLCPMGNYHQAVAEGVRDIGMMVVESGIGYEGVFAQFKVFESYAWMHHVYGLLGQRDGNWYDCVIPNYFDPVDFPYCDRPAEYALYIGRLIRRKGVQVAVEVTRELGMPLVIAGQGALENEMEGLALDEPHVIFLGAVSPRVRAEVMSRARVAFVPTYYVEPFGGVAVEAQMCGTPVVTSDWGAFTETVLHGVTGYRCKTFEQFCWAVAHIDEIDREACREWSVENYSMERVRWMYQEYFEQLDDLRGAGWYERRERRRELDWLKRRYV
jgi:glycosyltransferase involved in cell wall biosynthesis